VHRRPIERQRVAVVLEENHALLGGLLRQLQVADAEGGIRQIVVLDRAVRVERRER
jgi:hypothetical protein